MESVWEYRALLLSGTLVTVQLAIGSLLLSVLLGFAGASAKLARNPVSQRLANAYTTLVRGVPDLVLMMLLFYGGQQVFNDLGSVTGLWDYIEINQFTAGVGSIGFVFGAYMTETFRGAWIAVPRGQAEAARALGMPAVAQTDHGNLFGAAKFFAKAKAEGNGKGNGGGARIPTRDWQFPS